MKWYLITEFTNPGDEWAREGVCKLIKSVDQDAVFHAVNKFTPEINKPYEADRYVFCGQPLIWSHDTHATWNEYWWDALNGWIADSGRLILAGVGMYAYLNQAGHPILNNIGTVFEKFDTLASKCKSVYTRDEQTAFILGVPALHPCPSIFAGMGTVNEKTFDLCNMMPAGAHDYGLAPGPAQAWQRRELMVAKTLNGAGFTFISHSRTEDEYLDRISHDIGGIKIIRFCEHVGLLNYYSRCRRYFGNRIHGGIVARSFGANALVCGYDSRLSSVRMVGGNTIYPEDLTQGALEDFLNADQPKPLDISKEFALQQGYFK